MLKFFFLFLIVKLTLQSNSTLSKSLEKKLKCSLPLDIDPYEKTIKPYIKTYKPKTCYTDFYYAVLDLKTGIIKPNFSIMERKKCSCVWNGLAKLTKTKDLNKYVFKEFKPFNDSIDMNNLPTDLVLIRCQCGMMKRYQKLFSYPNFKLDDRKEKASIRLQSEIPNKKDKKTKNYKECPIAPNVIVLVIESLSHINYKRHMKQTQNLFKEHFNSTNVELAGVVKVGDNSYPNMITLITGKPPLSHKWQYGIARQRFYDNDSIIWKDFENLRGYYSAYIEDMPTYGIFNYVGKGFMKKGADFYNRNFFCAIDSFYSSGKMDPKCYPTTKQCYNGRNLLDIQFEQLESFIARMEKENQNYFIYADPGFLTHEDFNMASVMDYHVSRFMKRNLEVLKNSVFLFLGDHGNRYGVQMNSWVGRIESSMPHLSISIPKIMQQKYPHIMNNLKMNSRRLVTWVDVHTSLKELVTCDLEIKKKESQNLIKSNVTKLQSQELFEKRTNYSLFNEIIPLERTCEDALIPSAYCVCYPRTKISKESLEAELVGQEFVKKLNSLIKVFDNQCYELKMDKVIYIQKLDKGIKNTVYDLVVAVKPSKGIFRGELTKLSNNTFILSEHIERYNLYGKSGDCIKDKSLAKVCYCKDRN